MTTIDREEVACGVCNGTVVITVITSTNSFGSPDLDTRPPPMARETISTWVNRCPHCHYCRSDITDSAGVNKEHVDSDEYQNQLSDSRFSPLVNSFLCEAILEREQPDSRKQFWSLLSAAWACDDDGNIQGSNSCREMASEVARKCRADGVQYCADAVSEDFLLVDVLRRCGKFEEARKVISDTLTSIEHDVGKAILIYQGRLMDRNDRACHTIEQAMTPYADGDHRNNDCQKHCNRKTKRTVRCFILLIAFAVGLCWLMFSMR